MKNRIKYIAKALAIVLVLNLCILSTACADTKPNERELIRLHIRADSNLDAAQSVKLKVRDAVVAYLERESLGSNFDEAYRSLAARLSELKQIADKVLKEYGFGYTAKATLRNEYFPTRSYGDLIFESGFYDALIIELGSGNGDNWWCVIYPPLCYLESTYGGGITFKSKIKELWDKYFNLS